MPSIYPSILLALALARLSTAIDDDLEERAAAPIPQPVPSNCGVQVIYVNSPGTSWSVSNGFYQRHIVYTASQVAPAASGISSAQQKCTELCYGYGDTCVSSLWAENIPSRAFGTTQSGGTACFLFNSTIGQGDLMAQPKSTFANVLGSNLFCDDGCSS